MDSNIIEIEGVKYSEDLKKLISCSKNIQKVTIPDSVQIIEKSAFDGCSNLSEISFSSKLTSIGEKCFNYCHNLDVYSLPEGVKHIPFRCFF